MCLKIDLDCRLGVWVNNPRQRLNRRINIIEMFECSIAHDDVDIRNFAQSKIKILSRNVCNTTI